MTSLIQSLLAAGQLIPVNLAGGKKRGGGDVFNFASEAAGTYLIGAPRPRGSRLFQMRWASSITLGSTTFSLGVAGDLTKYRAAATFTSVDTWAEVGLTAAMMDEITAPEQLIMTTASGALPASGRMLFQWGWVDPS